MYSLLKRINAIFAVVLLLPVPWASSVTSQLIRSVLWTMQGSLSQLANKFFSLQCNQFPTMLLVFQEIAPFHLLDIQSMFLPIQMTNCYFHPSPQRTQLFVPSIMKLLLTLKVMTALHAMRRKPCHSFLLSVAPPPSLLINELEADTSILGAFDSHWQSLDGNLSLSLYSDEENVQLDLLQTLKRLCAPLIAYNEVMKWVIRSCLQGHNFRDIPVSSRRTVMDKLKARVDLQSLQPLVKALCLPYSKYFVEVVYFGAHSVFGIFSCPQLNLDQNYIFNNDDNPDCNPFAKPNGAVISDVNSGRSYLRTYALLIKEPNQDMLLPCILVAIDKTTCDNWQWW